MTDAVDGNKADNGYVFHHSVLSIGQRFADNNKGLPLGETLKLQYRVNREKPTNQTSMRAFKRRAA